MVHGGYSILFMIMSTLGDGDCHPTGAPVVQWHDETDCGIDDRNNSMLAGMKTCSFLITCQFCKLTCYTCFLQNHGALDNDFAVEHLWIASWSNSLRLPIPVLRLNAVLQLNKESWHILMSWGEVIVAPRYLDLSCNEPAQLNPSVEQHHLPIISAFWIQLDKG